MQERKDKYSLELCCVLRKKHQSPSSECTPPGELGVWMNGNISLYLAADAYSEGSSVSSLQAPFVISGKKSFFNLQFIWTTLAIYFRIRWIMLWKHLCLHLLQEKTGWVGQVQYRNENRQTLLKSILSILKMGTLETWDWIALYQCWAIYNREPESITYIRGLMLTSLIFSPMCYKV